MEKGKVEGEGSEKEDISVREITSMSEEHQIKTQKMVMCLSLENCKNSYVLFTCSGQLFKFVSLHDTDNLYAPIYQDQLSGEA